MAGPNLFRSIAPSTRQAIQQVDRVGANRSGTTSSGDNGFIEWWRNRGTTRPNGQDDSNMGVDRSPGLTAQQPYVDQDTQEEKLDRDVNESAGLKSYDKDPTRGREDSTQFLSQMDERLNTVSRLFQAFSTLDGEALSPQAKEAIRQAREDAAIEVGRINEQIVRFQNGISGFQNVADVGRGMVEQALQTSRAGVAASTSATQAQVQAITGESQSAVAQAATDAVSKAIAALPVSQGPAGAPPGQPEYAGDFYFGGVESDTRRAALEAQAGEDIRSAENLIATSVGQTGDLTNQIVKLTGDLTNSQLDLMGITDEKQRLQMTSMMETSLRNNIHNLVQNRQDIERMRDRIISGIEMDEANRNAAEIDQFGIGLSSDPMEIFENTFIDEIDKYATRFGWDFNEFQTAAFVDEILNFVALPPNSPDFEAGLQEFAAQMGINPDDLRLAIKGAEGVANAIAQEASDFENKTKFVPGSTSMAVLIQRAALEAGLDPDTAQAWANSNVLHHLIATQSGGRTGVTTGGDMSGIGGLTNDVYNMLGIDYNSIRGDAVQEMAAFLSYIQAVYGDPQSAAVDFLQTQSFGSLPVGMTPISSPQGSDGSSTPSITPRGDVR